jgi:hypothetical protein
MTNARQEANLVSDITAKGDIVVGSAKNTFATLNVGANNTVLVANSSATPGVNWTSTLTSVALAAPIETWTTSATAATGTINFDCSTQGVLYYTTAASANFTLNFRGNGTTSLNTLLATGQTITVNFLCTNTGTPYYANAYQVDGSAVTPKWSGGTAPSAGNASAVDIYSFTISKTGSATYNVFASGPIKYA